MAVSKPPSQGSSTHSRSKRLSAKRKHPASTVAADPVETTLAEDFADTEIQQRPEPAEVQQLRRDYAVHTINEVPTNGQAPAPHKRARLEVAAKEDAGNSEEPPPDYEMITHEEDREHRRFDEQLRDEKNYGAEGQAKSVSIYPLAGEKAAQRATRSLPENLGEVGEEEDEEDALSGYSIPSSPGGRKYKPQLTIGFISPTQIRSEANIIYKNFELTEDWCIQAAKPYFKTEHTISDDDCATFITGGLRFLQQAHDYFLASQHPSADQELRNLPVKEGIAVRVWRHGIHTILEIFRYRLPQCREFIDSYVRTCYHIIGVFSETLKDSRIVWMECLGDVARYMMAIEQDASYRLVWNKVAFSRYQQVLDETPHVGRLSHHQALLSGNAPLKQLVFYILSLSCRQPFIAARASMAFFASKVVKSNISLLKQGASSWIELQLLKLHASWFLDAPNSEVAVPLETFSQYFGQYLRAEDRNLRETGVSLAITRSAFCVHYPLPGGKYYLPVEGIKDGEQLYKANPEDRRPNPGARSDNKLDIVRYIFMTFHRVYELPPDPKLYSYVHGTMISLSHMISDHDARLVFEEHVQWNVIVTFINKMQDAAQLRDKEGNLQTITNFREFPPLEWYREKESDNKEVRMTPLPEDYLLIRARWSEGYYPDGFLDDCDYYPYEERAWQNPRFDEERAKRILHLAYKLTLIQPLPPIVIQDHYLIVNPKQIVRPEPELAPRLDSMTLLPLVGSTAPWTPLRTTDDSDAYDESFGGRTRFSPTGAMSWGSSNSIGRYTPSVADSDAIEARDPAPPPYAIGASDVNPKTTQLESRPVPQVSGQRSTDWMPGNELYARFVGGQRSEPVTPGMLEEGRGGALVVADSGIADLPRETDGPDAEVTVAGSGIGEFERPKSHHGSRHSISTIGTSRNVDVANQRAFIRTDVDVET